MIMTIVATWVVSFSALYAHTWYEKIHGSGETWSADGRTRVVHGQRRKMHINRCARGTKTKRTPQKYVQKVM